MVLTKGARTTERQRGLMVAENGEWGGQWRMAYC